MPPQYTQTSLTLETKHCPKCGAVKPVTEFHRRKTSPDGHVSHCKACRAISADAWRAANLEKAQAREAAYRAANPEKVRARTAAWVAANPERAKAGVAAWHVANAEKERVRSAAWRADHPDRVRERAAAYRTANKDRLITYNAAWSAANPDKVIARTQRHNARKRGATISDFTSQQWEELKEEYGSKCAYCGCTPDVLTMDHVVPLSRGGDHTESNIVPACKSCNSSKCDRLLSEWAGPRW